MKHAGSYHHGSLRPALIAAAHEALEAGGPESISLRSLAVSLGVSQPAPYRHFSSREALLAAVATDGFERFRAAMAAAARRGSLRASFEQACLAYLDFGRNNKGLYRLMFASRLLKSTSNEALKQAAEAAFGFLLEQITLRVAADQVRPTAIWVWSTLHGLVMLEAEELVSGSLENPVSSAEIVRRMAETLA